jgi:hypothetical protein
VGIYSTRCGTKEIKKRKYIKEKKVKIMSLKTKLKLYEYINAIWMSIRHEYGDDAAKTLILHWLEEIKDKINTK